MTHYCHCGKVARFKTPDNSYLCAIHAVGSYEPIVPAYSQASELDADQWDAEFREHGSQLPVSSNDPRPPQPPDYQSPYSTNLAPTYIAEQIFFRVLLRGGAGNP